MTLTPVMMTMKLMRKMKMTKRLTMVLVQVADGIQYNNIKLCPRAAQTWALFCNRDLEINPMTLKLKGDLDIVKIYLLTENETASLRHSKLRV